MNGAPQLFFQRAQSLRLPRGPARGIQRGAKQKIYRRWPAYRREVRRTRSLPVWQNSYVRVRVLRFFLADNQEFGSGYEEHALARAGPCEFGFCRPSFCKRWGGQQHLGRPRS